MIMMFKAGEPESRKAKINCGPILDLINFPCQSTDIVYVLITAPKGSARNEAALQF